MDQRADYLIQILDKLGSPLMSAIVDAAQASDPSQDAQSMASLIGKSVELSISLANMADLSKTQDDSVRLALAAIASSLVGSLHKKTRQVPGDNDLKRVASALQAVLTFSENFTPDEANTDRLKYLEHQGAAADALQMNIQYMSAFVPAVNAIGAFPFGMPEQKLIMDVSSRITAQASALRKNIIGEIEEDKAKLVDLAVLKTFVEIYAACHRSETERLSNSDDIESVDMGAALKNVWSAFDLRVGMIEALAESLLPGGSSGVGKASGSSSPTPESPPAQAPQETQSAPPPEQKPPEQPAGGANPMSMFAKPKTEEAPAQAQDSEAAAAPSTPPPAPEEKAPESPPAQNNPMAMFAKPKNENAEPASPSEAKSESESSSGEEETEGGGGSSNPMSFFKKSD